MNSRAAEKNRETSIRRRTLLTFAGALATIALVLLAPAASFAAQAPDAGTAGTAVTVVEVSGLLDRIQARFLSSIVSGQDAGDLVVVRLDSGASVLSEEEARRLRAAIGNAPAPVTVWVGPGRDAKVAGGSELVVDAAAVTGRVPGADVAGDVDFEAPTLGDFIVGLDGRAGIEVPTKVIEREGRPPQRELAEGVVVSFAEPPFFQQMLHAVSTPTAAHLLVTVALLLLVFEFFTGGIGVAGGVAVICLAMGGFGLGALPTRPAGVALLVLGIAGYAIDVQVGVPRAWTAIGTAAYAAGSFLLFEGLSVPFLMIVLMLVAVALFMVAAMPAVVRTRFSTPTIGREGMVGEQGVAATDVAPDGVVTVRSAPWRARTNRATPIKAGDAVRVAAIDGLLLEVEPLEGAAQDYRERAKS